MASDGCFNATLEETIGRLNQKFFGRRVETIFKFPVPESRVSSKRFLRQMPDGTTQVQKVERNAARATNTKI